MVASFFSKIKQLQKDLTTEITLMDMLAQKHGKFKVLSVKLSYATKRLKHMESKKAIF